MSSKYNSEISKYDSEISLKKINLTFLLFLSYYLNSLYLDVGFALKPYMLMTFIYFFLEFKRIKISKLELNEVFMMTFYLYYMSTIIVSTDKILSSRLFMAVIINLSSYFILRYALLKINYKTLKNLIYTVGLIYNLISLLLYVIGLIYVSNRSLPYGVYFGVLADGGMLRLVGLHTDPNFFMLSNFLFIYFYLTNVSYKSSKFALALAILNSMLTISRSGYLVLFLTLLIYLLLNFRKAFKNIVIFIFIGIVVYYIFSNFFEFDLLQLVLTRFGVGNNIDLTGGRLDLFEKGIEIFKENPIFGVGLYNSGNYVQSLNGEYQVLHNTYLDVLVESGLIGIFLFLFFIITLFFQVLKAYRTNKKGLFVLLSIISTLMMITTLTAVTSEYLFIYFAFSNVLIKSTGAVSNEEFING